MAGGVAMSDVTATITKMLAAMPAPGDRERLIDAHKHAAAFHDAMESALKYQRDIEDDTASMRAEKDPVTALEWHADILEQEEHYKRALGDAAAAMAKMPAKWVEILGVKI